ncbi:DUF4369 domain-containing protein, partial [Pedobacter sp.]|uniref:DUF4369 domain-containing protein n=1 Tax=Pedobacter sp. TaxID=1411316 RepID=UPI003D7F8029
MNCIQIKMIFALCLSPLAAFTQAGDFKIEGKVNSKYNGAFVKLYISQNDKQTIDSFQVKKGIFKFHGKVSEPTLGTISMNKPGMGDRIALFLSQGTVRVSTKDSLKNALITGTKLAEEQDILSKLMSDDEQKLSTMIHTLSSMPKGPEKEAYIQDMMKAVKQLSVNRVNTIHQFAKNHPDSYVTLYHLVNNVKNRSSSKSTTLPYFENLSEKLKETPVGKQFKKE